MSDNLEPIELKFVMNSPELMAEFEKVMGSVKNYDASIASSKRGFADFVADQLKAINVLDQNAQLTDKQAEAVKRHGEALEWLKEKQSETTDPTQLAIYQQQLNQISVALQKITDASNKNVNLLNQKEIEAANEKLNDALSIIDKIGGKKVDLSFASDDELVVLADEINKTETGLEALGVVIDFISTKMKSMDIGSEKYQELQKELTAFTMLMGETGKIVDTSEQSITNMTATLKLFQEQLKDETDPEVIQNLNQNIEALEKGLQKVKNAGKTGFDEFGNKLSEQKDKTVGLQTELEGLVAQMARLRLANNQHGEEYETLKAKAVETKNAISEVNNEINEGVKEKGNLQGLINITKELAAGYGIVAGAVGIFNGNEEESQVIIQKVTAVTAILQSLQEIQVAINKEDAATTLFLANTKNLLSAASLRLATALGISQVAATALIATLTLGLSLVITALIIAFDSFSERQKEQAELNKKIADSLAEPILSYRKLREEWNALGNDLKAKEKFITDNASEFNKLGVEVKNVNDAENLLVKNTNAMETALMQRAKAAAAMALATETYKKALEAQLEAESDQEILKNGSAWERGFVGLKVNSRFTTIGDQIDEAEKKADKFFKKSLQYEKDSEKTLNKAGIKESSSNSSKFKYSVEILAEEKKLEIAKARYGKADEMERALYDKKLAYAKKDQTEFEKITQDKAVFEARILKGQDDEAKKAADKKQREDEAAVKKAQRLAEQAAEARARTLEKIAAAEKNSATKSNEGDEIAAIKKRYEILRNEAKKTGVGKFDLMRIDTAEKKETNISQYDIDTKNLLKSLTEQKDIYQAYEALKTKIGAEEAQKRYNINVSEFGSFGDLLDSEIKKLTDKQERTFQENERLKALQSQKKENDTDQKGLDENKYAQAYTDAVTHQEKLSLINKTYADKAIQLQKITDGNLRQAKLAENEKQRQDAINSANSEAYMKSEIFRQLSNTLMDITKKELAQKIIALQNFLTQAKNLTPEQKTRLNDDLSRLKSLQAESDFGVYYNTLLEKKRLLEESIKNQKDKSVDVSRAEFDELAKINGELKRSVGLRAQMISDGAARLSGAFQDMASAIGDSNEGLSAMLETTGDILNVASSAAGAFASFASGDIIGGITGVMKTISGIFSIGKKARESEKKAQEEIKKRQAEQLQAQLDYNATLRQRMVDEVRINDLYKSRVDNIKEEIAARTKAMQQNLKEQQQLFNRLLNMTTVVGQHTEKYGGVFGIGRKTKVVDETNTIGNLLGVGANAFVSIFDQSPFFKKLLGGNSPFKNLIPADTVMITDEMFDKLEKLNSQHPLTGDAKTAYEQLKKLRDEYGSFAEANRQLEIQLKNAITGTTAQALADSIREGLKSGKKSFADFADDIEGFLREAVLSGISAKMIEPKIQELQDALADMMGDGILSQEERDKFNQMYMAIVNSSQDYMNLINQAGVNLTTGSASVNSLSGALKGASQESIDLLSGHTMGMRLTQLETNQILKSGGAQMLEKTSQMIEIQVDIEKNTRRTADNTEKLFDVNDNLVKVVAGQDKNYKSLQAAGIIK